MRDVYLINTFSYVNPYSKQFFVRVRNTQDLVVYCHLDSKQIINGMAKASSHIKLKKIKVN